jgi:hypothetical protein
LLASDTLRRMHAVDGSIARNALLGAVAPLPAAGQVRVSHPDWGDSCRQGTSSLTPSGATTAPVGRHATRPTAPGPQDRANVAAGADITCRTGTGTSSRTSTAAHSSSPSQDPEQAGVIDGSPDHLPAAVALHRTAKGMWSPTAVRPSTPPWERPADLRTCWSGRSRARRLRTRVHLIPPTDDPSLPEPSRRPTSVSAGQGPVVWAWLDLNQRPHPYQVSRAKRCAARRFPRSSPSVRAKGCVQTPRPETPPGDGYDSSQRSC